MRLKYTDAIKHEIENVFGRRIVSSRDCLELSDEIFNKTQKCINPNTLRRVFGLVKAAYPPSHSTLTILSEYCGFQSAEDIYKINRDKTNTELIDQDVFFHYLGTLFEVSFSDKCDKTFLIFIKNTVRFLNKNLPLADKFQCMIAKTQSGQDFYFEQFVNIDMFNSYYCNGLRYYLNEKRTEEAMIFANSILVYKYWLNNDEEKVVEHASKIPSHIAGLKLNANVNCRYYAARLFQAQVLSLPGEHILVDIYKFYSAALGVLDSEQLFHFEYVIAEALVLTGHYNDAKYYLGQFDNRFRKAEYCKYTLSLQNVRLLKAFAHLKTNDVTIATDVFNSIKPSDFHFTTVKFACIMYTYLSIELKRKSFKYGESFDSLINETGFTQLRKLYNPNIN